MKRNRVLLIAAAVLANIFWLRVFDFSTTPRTDTLVENLNARLREESFDELYEQSSDHLHLNVRREQFVSRMKAVSARLKSVDGSLTFRRDPATEGFLDSSRLTDNSFMRLAVRQVGDKPHGFTLLMYWDGKGRFETLTVIPLAGDSADNRTSTILYYEE